MTKLYRGLACSKESPEGFLCKRLEGHYGRCLAPFPGKVDVPFIGVPSGMPPFEIHVTEREAQADGVPVEALSPL